MAIVPIADPGETVVVAIVIVASVVMAAVVIVVRAVTVVDAMAAESVRRVPKARAAAMAAVVRQSRTTTDPHPNSHRRS